PLVGTSVPVFWLGLVTILVFYARLEWAPPPGRLSARITAPPFITGFVVLDGLISGRLDVAADALKHLILPALVLSSYSLGIIARMMRGSMLEVLDDDYVRTARAKGLPRAAVLLRHAARNALIPVLTVVGLSFGGLLSGAVVTETVFAWPGLGSYAFHSSTSSGAQLPWRLRCSLPIRHWIRTSFAGWPRRTLHTGWGPIPWAGTSSAASCTERGSPSQSALPRWGSQSSWA